MSPAFRMVGGIFVLSLLVGSGCHQPGVARGATEILEIPHSPAGAQNVRLTIGGFPDREGPRKGSWSYDRAELWWDGAQLFLDIRLDQRASVTDGVSATLRLSSDGKPPVQMTLVPGHSLERDSGSVVWKNGSGWIEAKVALPVAQIRQPFKLGVTVRRDLADRTEARDLISEQVPLTFNLSNSTTGSQLVGLECISKTPFQGRTPVKFHAHGDIGAGEHELLVKNSRLEIIAKVPIHYVQGQLLADAEFEYRMSNPEDKRLTLWRDGRQIGVIRVGQPALRPKPLQNSLSLQFHEHLFALGDPLPSPVVKGGALPRGAFIENRFFNESYKRVNSLGKPGRYGVVSTIGGPHGRSRCWFDQIDVVTNREEGKASTERLSEAWWSPFHESLESYKLLVTPEFSGSDFPKAFLERQPVAEAVYGDIRIQPQFFDERLHRVSKPQNGGKYGLIATVFADGKPAGRGFARIEQSAARKPRSVIEMPPLPPSKDPWWRTLRRSIGDYPYVVFTPKEYKPGDKQLYPVVIFLHGGGAQNIPFLKDSLTYTTPFLTAAKRQPVIAIGAILDEIQLRWTAELIEDILLQTKQQGYRIDLNRVVIVGESSGGGGTWRVVNERPDLFAGAIVVGSSGPIASDSDVNRIKKVPIWLLNGAEEWNTQKEMNSASADTINRLGGHARFSIIAKEGHLLSGTTYNRPEFWNWILHRDRTRVDPSATPPF